MGEKSTRDFLSEEIIELEEVRKFLGIGKSVFDKNITHYKAVSKARFIPHTRPRKLFRGEANKLINAWQH